MLSVTALPHHLLPSFFPPPPPPPLSFCLVSLSRADSAALHVSLPLLLLLSVTNYAHICTRTPLDPTCHTPHYVLSSAILCLSQRHDPSLLFLSSLASLIYLTFSPILPSHLLYLLIFPCLHFSPIPLPHHSCHHLPPP